MILGIDLAISNCGLCFMNDDETCSFATIGIKDVAKDDDVILQFSKSLSKVVSDQTCYVDFHFNECFLPNKRKHIALKYFLAGVIFVSAKETYFIKPSALRVHFGFEPKMNKYKFHEAMLKDCYKGNGEYWKLDNANEHERDAYLLALMGLQLQRSK
jgi:hypothetical protein